VGHERQGWLRRLRRRDKGLVGLFGRRDDDVLAAVVTRHREERSDAAVQGVPGLPQESQRAHRSKALP